MINYLGQRLTNGNECPKILLYRSVGAFYFLILPYPKFIFPWNDECSLVESDYLLLLAVEIYFCGKLGIQKVSISMGKHISYY